MECDDKEFRTKTEGIERSGTKNPGTGSGRRERLAALWDRLPFRTKTLIAGGGSTLAVFAAALVVGAHRPEAAPSFRQPGPMGSIPGAIRIRPAIPSRSGPETSASVAGIAAAGVPDPGLGRTPSPAGPVGSLPALSPPPEETRAGPVSPEVLWRQVGSVAVSVARLSEAVSALSAEEAAVLRGQEWMMKEMTRTASSQDVKENRTASSPSSPLSDDRPAGPDASAPPPALSGWRVIGVSGNGAVLMDPSGIDHLVRKDSVLEGRTVVRIDPDSGRVRLSDGENLTP